MLLGTQIAARDDDDYRMMAQLGVTHVCAEVRNRILAALVRQAREQQEPVTTRRLLAPWPGLDAVYRRLAYPYAGRSDQLVS